MFEKFLNREESIESGKHHQKILQGVTINFGRPKSEILGKKLPDDVNEVIKTKEISVRVTEAGELKIIDGNTTLFNALKEGVDLDLINVVYTLNQKWREENDTEEYKRDNLENLLTYTREINEN